MQLMSSNRLLAVIETILNHFLKPLCRHFHHWLMQLFENAQPTSEDDEEPTTYVLSDKFEFIVNKIIQTGDR